MAVKRILPRFLLAAALGAPPLALGAQEPVSSSAQGVAINLVNVDLRSAVQMLAVHVDRPVWFGAIGEHRVTFTSPRPIPPSQVPGIIRQMVAEHGYVMEESEGSYRIRAAQQAAPQPPPQMQMPQQMPGGSSLASANGMELFVIRLRHARAADVAATVNALYGRASALGEIGQRRGTLNDELNANRNSPFGPQGQQPAGPPPGPSGSLTGELVIVPDFRTNSLLIRASRADYQLVAAAVEQVDVRPLQVLIEATVAYVSRDFDFGYGLRAGVGNVAIDGSANTTVGGETQDGDEGPADLVIRALNLGGVDLDLVLRAGQSRSNVVILDRPLVLAANNREAEIVVGEQRPFVSVQRSTDGGVLDEVVQYKDVGTTLRVLPTISADGFVQMEVTQEVNSATNAAGALGAPVVSTRAITTEVLVRDGHTVVLGGLSNSQRDRSRSGVPFLSDLPLIGGIFGSRFRSDDEFELFIFITPHVLDSDEAMDDATGVVRDRRNMRRAIRQPPLVPSADAPPAEPVPADPAQTPAPAEQP